MRRSRSVFQPGRMSVRHDVHGQALPAFNTTFRRSSWRWTPLLRFRRIRRPPLESRRTPLCVRTHTRWLEHRPDVGASVPARLTGELRFKIGYPDVIRPGVPVDRYRMGAAKVLAKDQQPGRAGLPHFPESDFLFTHASPRHGAEAHRSTSGASPLRLAG